MVLIALLAAASTSGIQVWSWIVSIIGGVLVAISLIWKGVPAFWGAVKKMRAKHQEALTRRIVAAVQPMFEESNRLLDDHMKREEIELEERAKRETERNSVVTESLDSMGRGLAGIAGALGVNLRDFESTAPKNEKR